MKLLFVINTLGLAGAEKALAALLGALPAETEIDLLPLIPRGEMIAQIPDRVRVLPCRFPPCPVLGTAAEKALTGQVLRSALKRLNGFRLLPYFARNLSAMKKAGRVQKDKLCWRLISDGAPRYAAVYDLAIAYLEGGSAYYVADHVQAKHKAAFVHIDYPQAGYGPLLDCGCYDRFERIYGVSQQVIDRFLTVYPQYADRMALFHNLIDMAGIRRKAEEGAGFTDGFTGTRLLSIGRLHPQKAYLNSIRVCRRLVDAGFDIRWYVLGEGAQRPELEREIARLQLTDRFLLLGLTQNPYPFLKQADLYLHTTEFEGRSVAIEEALTLGKCIVASDCTGNREQIENDVNGLLVPLSEDDVFEAVASLLRDPEKARRLASRAARPPEDMSAQVDALLSLAKDAER